MKLTIDIPDEMVETIVRDIMDNFPEASFGSALRCVDFDYKTMTFTFEDEEGDEDVILTKEKLLAAFPKMFTYKNWPGRPPPASADPEAWDHWLCQSDALTFDAFAQLAAFGEVIYG